MVRYAVAQGDVARFQELARSCGELVQADDQLLVLALQIPDAAIALKMAYAVLNVNCPATGVDAEMGNTALHLACARDFAALVKLVQGRFPVRVMNKDGNTPLHLACKAGASNCVLHLLGRREDDCFVRNKDCRMPYDMASAECKSLTNRLSVQHLISRKHEFFVPLVLYHDDCLEHINPRGETDDDVFESAHAGGDSSAHREKWESPDRLHAIMRRVNALAAQQKVRIMTEFNAATMEQLERAHSRRYIDFVCDLARELEGSNTFVPFTPRVQSRLQDVPSYNLKRGADSDTYFSKGSLKAASRAAGSAVAAVDAVLSGQTRCAMCVVRPPGHHAGVHGLLEDATSCGFCIFNNVMVGALHALNSGDVRRVAIVDIDVHHGNGTEEICRRVHDALPPGEASKLLFVSTHILDNNGDKASFYPGTGEDSDLVANVLNVPLAPLWRRKVIAPKTRAERFYLDHFGRAEFRRAIVQRVAPAVRAFNPELIVVSAGFDAANHDLGNQRMGGPSSAGFDLTTEDFHWIAGEMARLADVCCNSRLVCVLEGGYGESDESAATRSKSPSAASKIDRDPLARNVEAFIEGLVCFPRSLDEAADDVSEASSDLDRPLGTAPLSTRRVRDDADDDADAPRKRRPSAAAVAAAQASMALRQAPSNKLMQRPQRLVKPKRPRDDAAELQRQHERTAEAKAHQERAASYIQQVRDEFPVESATYSAFLELLTDYKTKGLPVADVSRRLKELFRGHEHLVSGFNAFLPPEAKVLTSTPAAAASATLPPVPLPQMPLPPLLQPSVSASPPPLPPPQPSASSASTASSQQPTAPSGDWIEQQSADGADMAAQMSSREPSREPSPPVV